MVTNTAERSPRTIRKATELGNAEVLDHVTWLPTSPGDGVAPSSRWPSRDGPRLEYPAMEPASI